VRCEGVVGGVGGRDVGREKRVSMGRGIKVGARPGWEKPLHRVSSKRWAKLGEIEMMKYLFFIHFSYYYAETPHNFL
jgi:hypothetical protein